jgi:hypothetical protein
VAYHTWKGSKLEGSPIAPDDLGVLIAIKDAQELTNSSTKPMSRFAKHKREWLLES